MSQNVILGMKTELILTVVFAVKFQSTQQEMYGNFGYLHAKLGMKTNVHTTGTAPWYSAVADWDFLSDLCIQQKQNGAVFSEI